MIVLVRRDLQTFLFTTNENLLFGRSRDYFSINEDALLMKSTGVCLAGALLHCSLKNFSKLKCRGVTQILIPFFTKKVEIQNFF